MLIISKHSVKYARTLSDLPNTTRIFISHKINPLELLASIQTHKKNLECSFSALIISY